MNTMKDVLNSLKGKTLTIRVDLAAGVISIKLGSANAPESYDSILEVGEDVFRAGHHAHNINTSQYLSIGKVIQVEAK